MPTKDPRSYIKTTPLPIPSQKGLKLQARGFTVYNPTSPSREEVWKSNYERRRAQMSEQGFYSYNHQPYKGVGDPFYLDEKKMILHSLGQWNANDDWDSTSSSEEEDDGTGNSSTAPQAAMTAAKFVLRRTRKDLNTLPKEVVRGRGMIRNVRLGHGLFDLIRQERIAKKAEAAAQKKKNMEAARNQWQPPRNSSSEEESDDDLDKDEDLENYFGIGSRDGTSEDEDMSSYYYHSGSKRYSRDNSSRFSSSTRAGSVAKKKKKQASPRPFTPQHTNLADVTEENENISKSSLFRQLCALNWILDAMNPEPGLTMGPISTCWSHLEIGGSKLTSKRAKEEKRAETDWEKWVNNAPMGRVSKKGSITRLNRPQRPTRLSTHPRFSVASTSISPSSSSSQVNTMGPTNQLCLREAIPEDQALASPKDTEDEETLHRTGIFKFLDEYYDSLRREAQMEEERQNALAGINNAVTTSTEEQPSIEPNGMTTKQQEEQRMERRRERKARKLKKSQESHPERFDSPEERNRSKYFLKDLRMSDNFRPKSSAELQEFELTKPSNRFVNLRQDLHNKFKEVQDDKAMTLHDVLEQMERERLTKCQNKFSNLRMHSMSYHRAVEQMRRDGERIISRPEDVRRQSSFRGNWYTDLLHSLSPDIKDVWYYRTVLQRLAKYGLIPVSTDEDSVENTSKQSVYRFLKALGALRHWEICSPDISAAIEFCREKIVDMSIDEYEEWFSQAFPKVSRPRTAPADVKGRGDNQDKSKGQGQMLTDGTLAGTGGAEDHSRSDVDRRNVKSSLSMRSRSGAKSAVSIANGADGRRRLVQSAVVRKKR